MKSTYFGLTSFEKSEQTLSQALTLVQNTLFPVVLGFEYYPVVVFGSGSHAAQLTESSEELRKRGMHLCESNRKGAAQIHSPGQLVIYPLVPLGHLKITQEQFVEVLQRACGSWFASLKVRGEGIASIIESEQDSISQYVISINISNDLKIQALVKGSDGLVNSLEKQGKSLELKEAFDSWILHFTNFLLQAIPAQKV